MTSVIYPEKITDLSIPDRTLQDHVISTHIRTD